MSATGVAQPPHPSRKRAYLRIAAAAAIAVALILVAGAYFYLRHPKNLAEEDTIVLADFDNKTGDPIFDDTLKQALSTALGSRHSWMFCSEIESMRRCNS